jgi:hypothetical protein
VDTIDDLRAAAKIGVGPRTQALLEADGMGAELLGL